MPKLADQLSSYCSGLGSTQSGANHIAMSIFGWFAVFGDVVSQAAQTFLPANVRHNSSYLYLLSQPNCQKAFHEETL